jgi:hypothetical protein
MEKEQLPEARGFCLYCGKRLRKLKYKKTEFEESRFHAKCWASMVRDIRNFHKIAYEKYNYEPLINGKPRSYWLENPEEKFIINWD